MRLGDTSTGRKHKEPQKCPCCGQKLFERKGIFRQLRPVSNAHALHGNCLCQSEHPESEHAIEYDDAIEVVAGDDQKKGTKHMTMSPPFCDRIDPIDFAIMRTPLRK